MGGARKVFTGGEFGRWTVKHYRPRHSLCICKCGTVQLVANGNLANGGSTACKKCARERRTGVNLAPRVYKRLFTTVDNALKRCNNPASRQWADYGGRGIKICSEWLDDKYKFVAYLSTLDGHDNPDLWLDRIDNDGHYQPGNLRFVTRQESSRNRRAYGHKLKHGSDGRFVTTK